MQEDMSFVCKGFNDHGTEALCDSFPKIRPRQTPIQRLEGLSLTSGTLVETTSTLQKDFTKTALNVIAIASDLKRILLTLGSFSNELLVKIAAHAYVVFHLSA